MRPRPARSLRLSEAASLPRWHLARITGISGLRIPPRPALHRAGTAVALPRGQDALREGKPLRGIAEQRAQGVIRIAGREQVDNLVRTQIQRPVFDRPESDDGRDAAVA